MISTMYLWENDLQKIFGVLRDAGVIKSGGRPTTRTPTRTSRSYTAGTGVHPRHLVPGTEGDPVHIVQADRVKTVPKYKGSWARPGTEG